MPLLKILPCRELAVALEQTLNTAAVNAIDKDMLRRYYKLDDPDSDGPSFKQLGKEFGMTHENVRVRLKKALKSMADNPKVAATLGDYHVAEILDY